MVLFWLKRQVYSLQDIIDKAEKESIESFTK